MSVLLHVSLLSGKGISIETELDADIEEFRKRAQMALSVGKGRLIDSSGTVLSGARTIDECCLQTGDVLTLQVQPVRMAVTKGFETDTFAAILGDGSVVTWGRVPCSATVKDQKCAARSSQSWCFCSRPC